MKSLKHTPLIAVTPAMVAKTVQHADLGTALDDLARTLGTERGEVTGEIFVVSNEDEWREGDIDTRYTILLDWFKEEEIRLPFQPQGATHEEAN